MKQTFGVDYFDAKRGVRTPVIQDTSQLINGHTLILGASGVGKSVTLRSMIRQAVESIQATGQKARIHIFDVHGDLEIAGASVVHYSETSPYGLNPFRVNPSPEYGGVRKAIQAFIRTVDQASRTPLGLKQESVIRELCLDVYRDFGFDPADHTTWSVNALESRLVSGGTDNRIYLQVPFAEKDAARAANARWSDQHKLWYVQTHQYTGDITRFPPAFKARTYPTLTDIVNYASQLHLERFLGSEQKAVRALEHLNKVAKSFQARKLAFVKRQHHGEKYFDEGEEAALDEARARFLEASKEYANAVISGRELEQFTKYDSPETLKSVITRLRNLDATGIYKDMLAPFDPSAPVWRYHLAALSLEEKKMLVMFSLLRIFYDAVQRGPTKGVVEVVVIDELGSYGNAVSDDKGDGIIGTIAREARKFGLALWAANQSQDGVPDSLITSLGTKVLLGIDERYWQDASKRLRVETNLLKFVTPWKTMAVQMKEAGKLSQRWRWVNIDDAFRHPSDIG